MARRSYIENLLMDWGESQARTIPGLSYASQTTEYRLNKFGFGGSGTKRHADPLYNPPPIRHRQTITRANQIISALSQEHRYVLELRFVFQKKPADMSAHTATNTREWEDRLKEAIQVFRQAWRAARRGQAQGCKNYQCMP